MFFIFFSVCLLILILFFFKTSDLYQGPVTDHFNGKKFFNPEPYKIKTFLDLLRWYFSYNRSKWPKHVENEHPPALSNEIKPNKVRITFVNHSTVLIQTHKLNFLTDPIWSNRASPFQRIGPARVRNPGVPFNKLPKIDMILISHNHYDHLDLNTLHQLNSTFHPLFLVPLGIKNFLKKHGILSVIEMDWWQTHSIDSTTITFLPAKHWSLRGVNDKCRTLWGSFGINIENKKIFFAGDTGYSEKNFKQIYERYGAPDVALLPIGSYQPEWFMQDNHLNPKEAVEAHLLLHAKYSIPIHYGTFQLSDEGINKPLLDLEIALKAYAIQEGTFVRLQEGFSREW